MEEHPDEELRKNFNNEDRDVHDDLLRVPREPDWSVNHT
jgi:hypothetical protein